MCTDIWTSDLLIFKKERHQFLLFYFFIFPFFPSSFLSFFLFCWRQPSRIVLIVSLHWEKDREADMKENWSSSLICSFISVVFVVPSLCPILSCALFNRQRIGRVCQMFLERDLERRRWKVVQSACAILFFYSRILYTRSNILKDMLDVVQLTYLSLLLTFYQFINQRGQFNSQDLQCAFV